MSLFLDSYERFIQKWHVIISATYIQMVQTLSPANTFVCMYVCMSVCMYVSKNMDMEREIDK